MTTRSMVGRPRVARALAAIFTLLAALLLGIQAPTTAHAADTATISGKVTLESGVPAEWMRGVNVSVSAVSGPSYGSATPRSDGTFSVTGLEEGVYRVRFQVFPYWDDATQKSVQPNLFAKYYGDTTSYSAAKLVSVTAGGTASRIDATMEKGSIVTGKVTLPSTAPAEWYQGVTVSASTMSGGGYGSAMIAKDGTYKIVGLEAGDYRIQFSSSKYYPISGTPVQPNLISEYYDDATYENAKAVTLTKGKTTSGINATLAQGATISGKISLPRDVPAGWMAGVTVTASAASGNGANAVYAYPDPDGSYTLSGLRADTYRLRFSANSTWWNPSTEQSEALNLIPEYYNDTVDWDAAQSLTVASGEVKSGIDAALAKGGIITGTITAPGGMPADWSKGISVSASPDGPQGYGSSSSVRPDGTYTIAGLSAGTYRVSFSAYSYLDANANTVLSPLVSEYYDGTQDYNKAKKVTVTAGGTTSKIDASLEAGATITGKITLPPGAPKEWLGAVHPGVSLASGEYVSSQYMIATDGSYTVTGLPPGDYTLRFGVGSIPTGSGSVRPNLLPEYYDDAPDAASARVLTLASGQVRTKTDVTLSKGSELTGTLSGVPLTGTSYLALIDSAKPESGDYVGTSVGSDGSFSASGLRAGSYWVRLYAGSQWQFLMNPSGGYAFSVEGEGLLNQTLTAQPTTASITGSLTTSGFAAQTSAPNARQYLADTRVYQKLDSTWVPLDFRGFFVDGAVSAEKNGTVAYTVPGLAPGTYTVGFEKSQTPYSANPAVTEQWWKTKSSLASADELKLTAGQKKTGIDGTVTGSAAPATGFIDIAGSAFTKEITWMYDQGISTGYDTPNGREYRPFGKVTRDAMAAFLYRAAGSPQFDAPKTSPFTDVPTNHPFFKEIAWLSEQNISNGWAVNDGKEYRPTLNITRDAMAAFLYRYAKASTTAPAKSPFVDVPADSAFLKEIAWLSERGISTGWDAGHGGRAFKPFDEITRDAMAAFLYRYKSQ